MSWYRRSLKTCWMAAPLLLAWQAFGASSRGPQSTQGKCPVCGMFVAKYPDWTAVIAFRDGTTVAFDGPKDFFTYVLRLKAFNAAREPSDISALTVKDYYTLAPIDARKAFYVLGSDVFGPMGKELIPFASATDAGGFMKDHAGKRVVAFGEITLTLMKSLE